ncbi:MAG: RDD family protein [Cytophagia bacterium]|nr:MAG: RDD family protein [Cytophagales bacterium]TAG42272.1 MAG: RDD family protein [Cytophagia bacterium]TAG69140.1 MAG: RDD family protein [Runella slithyformis]TAG84813.1 MAG: RDD family protein [Cytophagales bacterium]
MGAVQFIIIGPILGLLGIGAAANVESFQNMDETQALGMASAMAGAGILLQVIGLAVSGTYFILMESSERQATVGKLAMGIKVTDLNGQRITRMAAFIRFIGKIVSGIILLIGYIMAAFTEKKQALHDIIANTLVLK